MKLKYLTCIILTVMVSSCSHFTKSLYEETDKVMKSNRVMYETSFDANKRYEQIYWQKLLFQKETDRYQNTKYALYDIVSMPLESYNLKDTMYVVVDKDKYGLYTLGKTLGPKNALGVTVATSDALQTWQTMQKTFAGTTPDYGQDIVDSFSIIATTDSTINETITNDYGENAINKIPSMLG